MPGPRLDRALSHWDKRNRCRPARRPGDPDRLRATDLARRAGGHLSRPQNRRRAFRLPVALGAARDGPAQDQHLHRHLRVCAALHPDRGHTRHEGPATGSVRVRQRLSLHPAAAVPGRVEDPGHPRARAAEGARRQRQAATWNCLTCKATLDSAQPTVNLLRMSQTAELQRRVLLAESDILLDDVETLRLLDLVEAPPRLREAIRALQIRLGRRNPPLPSETLDAAHELVFAVQQRLMAANPRNPRPLRHAGRPSGQPMFTIVRDDKKWKVLTLPPPSNGEDADWIELVDSTVERAWDRWCYAQQQAARATRLRMQAHTAVAVLDVAWNNYWALLQDSERIKRRISGVRGRLAGGTPAAPRL